MQDHNLSIGAVAEQPRGLAFDEWRGEIALATDVGQVMAVVRAYFRSWKSEELDDLRADLAGLVIETPGDLIAAAVLAGRAEVKASANASLLREVSLTLAAAATRIRRLAGAA